MKSLILFTLSFLSLHAFAKNESMLASLTLVAAKDIKIPANSISTTIAFNQESKNYCQVFYGGGVPFERTIKTGSVFVVQGGAEDERRFMVNDLLIIAKNGYGLDIGNVADSSDLDTLIGELAGRGMNFVAPKDVKTARLQMQSKKTGRGVVIECVSMDLPEALSFLFKESSLKPSTDI